ncbi:MAG: hypothetical protein US42_C0014G0060 [Candidatus Magasanikbacteria bacterium GW2011_GWC2_37_14]|uniref:DUF5673 domain-containing protein n=1 Tax=Candidatus Magasanikbacteria bacterium GW2011_GWC2_37_14 TaxID=1619046 RepID=A0A0G0G7U4_9BACT|nr:MAG: hypothetical protein US42_C0014G0060 [Candidatus Magasanikbacteria bacterium GW2011_GWC2_37_14]
MPQLIKDIASLGQVLHEWSILEYEQHERNTAWYVIMGVLGVGLVTYALLTGNFLFALIVVLFAIILFLQSHQSPRNVLFQITDLGVVVGSRFYPYSELNNFYVVYNPPEVKNLFISCKSTWRPLLRIPLLDKNPVEVKYSLREFLTEDLEKEDEPMSEKIGRNWRIH